MPKTKPTERAPGEKAAPTRDIILEAATKVFSGHPYHAASIRMIAAQGGFYHGLIRYHFPSKAGIFGTVVESACRKLKEANRLWLSEVAALGPRDGLALYLDRFLEHYRAHPEIFRIVIQNLSQKDQEGVPGYHHLLDLLSGSQADFREIFTGLFDGDSAARVLESFNALIIHYLGAADAEAWLLGMEPESPGYLEWVKETMLFVFLPVLEKTLALK